jgi:hypothetical protein
MNSKPQLEAVWAAVAKLDLSPIKGKLMHAASGEGWSLEQANATETEYRRFLCLMATYPDEVLAPSVDVDTFWHYHILDTMKYAADCEQAFGYFLHHYPYVGMHGEDDEQLRLDGGERMRTLYAAAFGAAPAITAEERPAVNDTMATAWCAGPGAKPVLQHGGIAWCAGPAASVAGHKEGGAIAWCAGPGASLAGRKDGGAIAWCAGPGASLAGRKDGGAVAWCAGPAAGAAPAGAGTAP